MNNKQKRVKRLFDFFLSLFLLIIFLPIILVLVLVASIDTKMFGLFLQNRVGEEGKLFKIMKIRTMKNQSTSKLGQFLRNSKLDELPQLINIFFGQMSFVGPRPDLEGFADKLEGGDRIILTVKPGLTSPASIKYKDEETILAQQEDSERYNKEVIWIDKVRMNKEYINNWSFLRDINCLIKSVI
ncbi:MAG: sugar transferase [Flavobacteriaceae bacterium]|nr:sugar transferase [Flavobacteriaceae bacterium]